MSKFEEKVENIDCKMSKFEENVKLSNSQISQLNISIITLNDMISAIKEQSVVTSQAVSPAHSPSGQRKANSDNLNLVVNQAPSNGVQSEINISKKSTERRSFQC